MDDGPRTGEHGKIGRRTGGRALQRAERDVAAVARDGEIVGELHSAQADAAARGGNVAAHLDRGAAGDGEGTIARSGEIIADIDDAAGWYLLDCDRIGEDEIAHQLDRGRADDSLENGEEKPSASAARSVSLKTSSDGSEPSVPPSRIDWVALGVCRVSTPAVATLLVPPPKSMSAADRVTLPAAWRACRLIEPAGPGADRLSEAIRCVEPMDPAKVMPPLVEVTRKAPTLSAEPSTGPSKRIFPVVVLSTLPPWGNG